MTPRKRRVTKNPALADTLGLMLPPIELRLLLRASLLSGPAVGVAWESWLAAGGPRRLLEKGAAGFKRHLPLLYVNLSRHGVAIDPRLQSYLRIALVRDELRHRHYRRVCRDALAALAEAHVDFILGTGTTLAETVFDGPAVRHCHDIDLLVAPGQISGAVEALRTAGFAASPAATLAPGMRLEHGSGLPATLHTDHLTNPFYPVPIAPVRQRTQTITVGGVPTRVMSAADMLVHVCAIASASSARDTLSWAVDACLLAQKVPELDWDVVVSTTRRGQLGLPLFVMLSYLAAELDTPVPDAALTELRAAAMRADWLRRQIAIRGIRAGARGRLADMLRVSGWRSRLTILRWMLFPSPAYLRWIHPVTRAWHVPKWYLLRPVRFVGRSLRGAPRRTDGRTALPTDRTKAIPAPRVSSAARES